MDDFKDSTKTIRLSGGGPVRGAAKIATTMREFKNGTLHSGSEDGPEVHGRKQAVAIALNQARKAGAKIPQAKADGGSVRATVDSANRVARLERGEERIVRAPKPRSNPKPAFAAKPLVGNSYTPAEERTALDRRLSEPPRGFAKGGLAAMPRGKKC